MTFNEAIDQVLREQGATEEQIRAHIAEGISRDPMTIATGKTTVPPNLEEFILCSLRKLFSMPKPFQEKVFEGMRAKDLRTSKTN